MYDACHAESPQQSLIFFVRKPRLETRRRDTWYTQGSYGTFLARCLLFVLLGDSRNANSVHTYTAEVHGGGTRIRHVAHETGRSGIPCSFENLLRITTCAFLLHIVYRSKTERAKYLACRRIEYTL